jgi:hypothetical protein
MKRVLNRRSLMGSGNAYRDYERELQQHREREQQEQQAKQSQHRQQPANAESKPNPR